MRWRSPSEEAPDLLVDMATLTGAARVALGPEVVPVYTRDDALAADARRARRRSSPIRSGACPSGRPTWRCSIPRVADINNAGSSRHAGSITAALFLSRFVPDGPRWLHSDIFAWTPATKPGRPEGGEAQAIRALYSLLKDRGPGG